MSTLVWKCCRENRSYFVLAIVASLLLTLHVIAYECMHQLHAFVGHFSQMSAAVVMVAAILLAMRTAKGEHSSRTQSFSNALPISVRTQAVVRLLVAMFVVASPILLSAFVLTIATLLGFIQQALPRTSWDSISLLEREVAPLKVTLAQLWSLAAIHIASGWQLLVILCVAGNWLKTQAQIGFLGPVLSLASVFIDSSWMLKTVQAYVDAKTLIEKLVPWSIAALGSISPGSQVIHWGHGSEQGDYADHQLIPLWSYSLLLFLVWLSIGVRLFVVGYGREVRFVSEDKSWWQKAMSFMPGVSLSFQFHSPAVSLIWLEIRKSVPMALLGLVLALLLACVDTSEPGTLIGRVPQIIWMIGLLWGAIVGSGVFAAELDSKLGNFWRSRPIDLRSWFAIKFIVGFLAVVIVLDGFAIVAGWNLPREDYVIHRYGMGWSYVVCMPILHGFIYTLAVIFTCWTRKPVLGGMLSLIVLKIITMPLSFFVATSQLEPTQVYNNLLTAEGKGMFHLSQHGFPLTYGLMYLSILPLAVAAYYLAKPLESYWQRYAR